MSSKNPKARRLVVADWEAAKREEGTVILDLGDAGEIEIEPPLFWQRRLPSDRKERAKLSSEQVQRLVIGDEQVDLWLSTGRTMDELDAAFTDAQGMDMGKSEASSKS